MANKVHYTKFDPKRVVIDTVHTKNSKPAPPKDNPQGAPVSVQYHEIPIKYRYVVVGADGKESEVLDTLCIEGPATKCFNGVKIENGLYGVKASLCASYDLKDPSTAAFVSFEPDAKSTMQQLHGALVDGLITLKARGVAPPLFSLCRDRRGFEEKLDEFIKLPTDKNTGQPIAGAKPRKFYDLISMGAVGSPFRRETPFLLPIKREGSDEYKRVEYFELVDRILTIIPLIPIEKISVVAKGATIKGKISSAVVMGMEKIDLGKSQLDTVGTIAADVSAVSSLKAQLELLRAGINAEEEKKKFIDKLSTPVSGPPQSSPPPVQQSQLVQQPQPIQQPFPTHSQPFPGLTPGAPQQPVFPGLSQPIQQPFPGLAQSAPQQPAFPGIPGLPQQPNSGLTAFLQK